MSEQAPLPAPGEPGSRENPNIVSNAGGDYYGGYAGNRIPSLDPRMVGGPESNDTMQAAADSLQKDVDARAEQAKEQQARPLAPDAITEVPDFSKEEK